MFKTILVPLDGSALAARTLPYATRLARTGPARLVLVRAVPGGAPPGAPTRADQPAAIRGARDALAAAAQQLQAEGLVAVTSVREQNPVTAILDASRAETADLIVMSSHGQGGAGRLIYGSVVAGVLRGTARPVLLISPACDRTWGTDRSGQVIVALDGSTLAEEAIAPARELAAALGAGLLLVRVEESAGPAYGVSTAPRETSGPVKSEAQVYVDGLVAELSEGGQPAEARVLAGNPVPILAELARAPEILAVTLATHGRSGLARLLGGGPVVGDLGSVPTALLRAACAPILLVRPEILRSPER